MVVLVLLGIFLVNLLISVWQFVLGNYYIIYFPNEIGLYILEYEDESIFTQHLAGLDEVMKIYTSKTPKNKYNRPKSNLEGNPEI